MNNRRLQDLDSVFESRWKANSYRYNGVKENIERNKEHFDKMYNIKSKEDKKKEILRANSVEGKVDNLNKKMSSLSMYNKNNFR